MLGGSLLIGPRRASSRVPGGRGQALRRRGARLAKALVVLALVIPGPAGMAAPRFSGQTEPGVAPALQVETETPSATPTEAATPTDTESPPRPSETPTSTLEPPPTPTDTVTPSSEPTSTATVTETGTPTPSPEDTPTPTETERSPGGILLVLEAPPEAEGPSIRVLHWRVEGWEWLRPVAEENIELPLFASEDLSSLAEELGLQAQDPHMLRFALAEAEGHATWLTPLEAGGPIYLRGELTVGGQVILSASRIVNAQGAAATLAERAESALLPLGWEGEASGWFNFSWSGAAGEFSWQLSPASLSPQLTRAYLAFSHGDLPDGSAIEVCSRGTLPGVAGPGSYAGQPVRAAPTYDAGVTFLHEDWLCVRQGLDLQDQSAPLRVGHFEGAEGWHSGAGMASEAPTSYSWQVRVKSLNGVEFPAPEGVGGGGVSTLTAGEDGTVYLATRGNLARSRNFYAATPHWQDVHGVLPIPIGGRGGLIEFTLDPFDPEHRAWVILGNPDSGRGGAAWRTDNLDASPPTWTEVLSEAEIVAALGGSTAWGKRVLASNLQPGLIFVAVAGNGGLSVGRSQDSGETWTWAEALGRTGNRAVGFELSDHDANRLWVGTGLPNSRVLVSNDGGASFQQLHDFGSWWNPYDIYVPQDDNPEDLIIFSVVDGPSNQAEVYRSLDGGTTWSIVTHAGSPPGALNRMVGSYRFDRQQIFYARVACSGPWAFESSTDGGTSWQTLYTTPAWLQAAWMSPMDPSHLLTARGGPASGPNETLNALYSSDGGVTWQDRAGDWATSIGVYYGAPGSCGGTGTVTIVDTASLLPIVYGPSARSSCRGVDGECPFANQSDATGFGGEPINTHTGGYEETVTDLSVPTSSRELSFQRSYSSEATAQFTGLLGYGWTHNHDTRLIFPGDPGGQPGYILFHAHSANVYQFIPEPGGGARASPGVLASLTRDDGPPVTYTLVDSTQTVYTFNESGRILTWSDPQGHAWTYTYNAGLLDRVTDETGQRYLDFSYGGQNLIQSVADHTGRDVTFGYDANGDLTTVTDVLDQTWTYVYDSAHRLRQALDPESHQVVRTEYDAQGRAYQQYDPSDTLVLQITYNADGTTTIVDGLGNETIHTYDYRNTLTGETDHLGNASGTTYAESFRPETLTDENQNTTQLAWSEDGANLTQVIDAEGDQVDLTYDDLNNLRMVVDGRRYTTTYTYNETDPDPGRRTLLLSVEDPLDNLTAYTYTTAADFPQPPGLLKTISDPLGHTTEFVYNEFGQRIQTIDPLDHSTYYSYDSLGRLRTTTDPLGHAAWTCYDASGRVVRTVSNATGDGGTPQTDPCNASQYVPSSDPDKDRVTTTVYDTFGNPIAAIDPAGVITRTYYDFDNRPEVVVQNLTGQAIEVETPPAYNPAYPGRNVRTTTTYDDQGNPIAVTDNAGIITRIYCDTLNRLEYVVVNLVGQGIGVGTPPAYSPSYPDRNVRSQTVYDDAGNVIATIETLGRITRTYYDANNRPVTVVQNLVGQGIEVETPPARSSTYSDRNLRTDTTYDANGNAIAVTDPLGIITRTYHDAANRPQYVVQNLVGQGIGVETPPAYDPQYPDRNVRTEHIYDDAGIQIALRDPNGVITRTYHDDANRPVTVVRNLVGQTVANPTPPARNPATPDENVRTDYYYDDAGNQIAVRDPNEVITRTYYDGLGRVRYVVQNLTGQGIEVGTPPPYNPAYPDQNVRIETIYDANGDAIATIDNAGVVTRM